jgi:uncharacterized membrane protein
MVSMVPVSCVSQRAGSARLFSRHVLNAVLNLVSLITFVTFLVSFPMYAVLWPHVTVCHVVCVQSEQLVLV